MRIYGGVIVLWAIGLLAVLVPRGVWAQQSAAGDWEPLPLTEGDVRLRTPANGALIALIELAPEPTENPAVTLARWQPVRSDDGGESWRPVTMPPDARLAAVDPTNGAILYAANEQGLHKSTDAGATWTLIRPDRFSPSTSAYERRLVWTAVSPANPQLLYLIVRSGPSNFELLRSRDGGAAWAEAFTAYGASPSYLMTVDAMLVHGTDPARLMLSVGSVQAQFGRVTQVLRQSADQGQTWSQGITVRQPPTDISHLQGWRGTLPTRLYLVAAGSELYRSDDDAATWTLVATFTREDGTADWRSAIGALTYDPARPDHVYIAVGGGVRASADSGSNWGPLGRQDLPRINDLALGVDGRYLYAATEAGLYRLPLAQRQREAPASVPAAR